MRSRKKQKEKDFPIAILSADATYTCTLEEEMDRVDDGDDGCNKDVRQRPPVVPLLK